MERVSYPAGLQEIPFVRAYHRTALRKPQVVSDTILRSLMTSSQDDRLILASSLVQQLSEACRRAVAVHDALFDRQYSIARQLAGPLPGVDAWSNFIDRAARVEPEAMLRDLGLGEDAEPAANLLRRQTDLSWITPVIAADVTENVMSLITQPASQAHRIPLDIAVATTGIPDGPAPDPDPALTLGIDDAATVADTTADMVEIARGFLGAYISARMNAGRQDDE